jgi:hypothetical protein
MVNVVIAASNPPSMIPATRRLDQSPFDTPSATSRSPTGRRWVNPLEVNETKTSAGEGK